MKKNLKILFSLFILNCYALFLCNFIYPQGAEKQIIESLEFREVDIKDVLRQLSKQYGLNIVFSEKVAGLVTVQLNNVTIEEAMDSIITVNGFVYTKRGTVIKVTTADEAEREGRQTKLFRLNNADALTLQTTLGKVLSSDGAINVDTRSNSLLVTDSLSVINKIEGMIPALDEVTPQVLIEAKFIETSLTKTEKLGIDWTTTISAAGSKIPTTLPFKSTGGWMRDYLPLSKPTASGTVGDFPSVGLAPPLSGLAYGFPYSLASNFSFGTLDFSSLKSVFDFLKERKNTKLVANPRILTLNSQKASISVGRVLSLPTYERNETTGTMEITGWEKMNVGVNLEVTPQISPDGHVKLKLKPEVSSLVGYTSTRDNVNEGPITSTRTAETEVLLRDGQTAVIGGLVKEESLSNVKKIPILGDIPLLGLLFTRKEVGSATSPTEKTDLLIFVTARIIKDKVPDKKEMVSARPFKLEARKINIEK
ncbi:MAG: secretin and TonB N-terminal domain-containing protein [Candidatus Omnitrophota bacterium]